MHHRHQLQRPSFQRPGFRRPNLVQLILLSSTLPLAACLTTLPLNTSSARAETQPTFNQNLFNQNLLTPTASGASVKLPGASSETPTPVHPLRFTPGVSQLEAEDVLPSANNSRRSLDQVTSVTQLSDVKPTDWAYQAVQSLVERYGCIAGYPNSTFRGQRATTRFELAAALNSCLDVVSDRFATKEDLQAVRRLQVEFARELAALKGRVTNLEGRTAKLEAHQFSTTTKLAGEAIVSFVAAGGGAPGGSQPNPIVAYRTRLNLLTSFTGKDTLITGLQSFNFGGGLIGGNSVQAALFPSTALNSGNTNLSFQPQFAGIDPNNVANSNALNPGSVALYKLLYVFPIAGNLTGFVFPKAEATDAFPQIIPWSSEGQGALSRFAGVNPVARLTTGTSGIGNATGLGFIWNPAKTINLTALYGVGGAANATLGGPLGSGTTTPLGSGFFPNGQNSFIAAAQATFKPLKSLDLAVNFAYAQHAINVLGTGLSSGGLLGYGGDVFAVPGTGINQRVQILGLGGTATYRITPKIAFSGYASALSVSAIGGTDTLVAPGTGLPNPNASALYTSFMGGVQFSDVFIRGNTAAVVLGQPLYLESTGGSANSPNVPGVYTRSRPFQVEGFYRYRVSDNISVTPGVFAIFSPEFNSENRTTVVGVVRTTFTF